MGRRDQERDRAAVRMKRIKLFSFLLFLPLISSLASAEKDPVAGLTKSGRTIGQGYATLKQNAMELKQKRAKIEAETRRHSEGEELYLAVENLWQHGSEDAYQNFIYDLTPDQRELLREYILKLTQRHRNNDMWDNMLRAIVNADNAYRKTNFMPQRN